ncbi:hypothetical protein [Actinotalea caeni]|uniref:hypothetical protein n=1 Tax=Actinotalea caeni TaxID=1348467 RepID=UPI0012E2C586|nr:hypothetical protein [Actinotalea caeni]
MSIIGYRHESQQGVRSRPRREAVARVLARLDASDAQTATPSDASKVYTLVLNGSTTVRNPLLVTTSSAQPIRPDAPAIGVVHQRGPGLHGRDRRRVDRIGRAVGIVGGR